FGQCLVAEMLERGFFERMTGACRVKQIAGEHRVELEPRERDAVPRQNDDVELQIVTELVNRRILEQRTRLRQHRLEVELLSRARARRRRTERSPRLRPDIPQARSAPDGHGQRMQVRRCWRASRTVRLE